MSNQAVQVESIRVEEVGIQAELVLQEETKKDFKCEECGIRVSDKSLLVFLANEFFDGLCRR